MHDPTTPGFNSIPDIRARLWAAEETLETLAGIDVTSPADGLQKVGNELRLDIASLPLAPEN